jgi:hypothetical protein
MNESFYLAIKKLILRATSDLGGLAGEDSKLFRSNGLLEYWSVGKSQNHNFNQNNH